MSLNGSSKDYQKYTKPEIERITGLELKEFFDLVRVRPDRGGDHFSRLPFFLPSKVGSGVAGKKALGKGYTAELNFSDLLCLSLLKVLKANRLDKSIGRFIWQILGSEEAWQRRGFGPNEIVLLRQFRHTERAPQFRVEVLYDRTGSVLARTVQRKAGERLPVNGEPVILTSTPEGMRSGSVTDGPLGIGIGPAGGRALRDAQVRHFEEKWLGRFEVNLNRISREVQEQLTALGR